MAQQTSSTGVSGGNNHQVDTTSNKVNRQGEAVRTGNTAIVQDARGGLPQAQPVQQAQQTAMPSVSSRPPPPATPPPFWPNPALSSNAPDPSLQNPPASVNAGASTQPTGSPPPLPSWSLRKIPPVTNAYTASSSASPHAGTNPLTSLAPLALNTSSVPSPNGNATHPPSLTSLGPLGLSLGSSSALHTSSQSSFSSSSALLAGMVFKTPETSGKPIGGATSTESKTRRGGSMAAGTPASPLKPPIQGSGSSIAGSGLTRDLPPLPLRPPASVASIAPLSLQAGPPPPADAPPVSPRQKPVSPRATAPAYVPPEVLLPLGVQKGTSNNT